MDSKLTPGTVSHSTQADLLTLNSISTRPESTEPRSVKRMAFQDELTQVSDLKGRALYSKQKG